MLVPKPLDVRDPAVEPAEGIEQPAVCGRLDQRAFVVLAVDFHQGRSQRTQHLAAYRLVVDERAGASVRELDAPQNELVVGRDVIRSEERAGWMGRRQLENRDDL